MTKTVYVGPTQFKVDLEQFQQAISTVTNCVDAINDDLDQITAIYQAIEMSWKGPAGESYQSVQSSLSAASSQMTSTLRDFVAAMHTSYNNYFEAEAANTHNVS